MDVLMISMYFVRMSMSSLRAPMDFLRVPIDFRRIPMNILRVSIDVLRICCGIQLMFIVVRRTVGIISYNTLTTKYECITVKVNELPSLFFYKNGWLT